MKVELIFRGNNMRRFLSRTTIVAIFLAGLLILVAHMCVAATHLTDPNDPNEPDTPEMVPRLFGLDDPNDPNEPDTPEMAPMAQAFLGLDDPNDPNEPDTPE